MNGEYIATESRAFQSLETPILTASRQNNSRKERLKKCFYSFLQILHFLISMGYLWAGFVEFIRNPPFFDAYGDAGTDVHLPPGLFQNDPRSTESGILRLMDLPILIILIVYQGVCIWLRYKGISWLLTISMTITFLFFWIVNFWEKEHFDWRVYSTRMKGLQFQVSSIAASGTMVFMVIFFKRNKFPFKFRSSLNNKQNSTAHILWNFFAIYLVMFASLMVWFIKLYASWACFDSVNDIMELCSTTNQVQCYPCSECTTHALKKCVANEKAKVFSCNSRFPTSINQGAFCTFNFNMSVYGFLLTFAYIGGLCVFLSTFLRISGHYVFRGFFLAWSFVQRLYYRDSDGIKKRFKPSSPWQRHCELQDPTDGNQNDVVTAAEPVDYTSDSDEEGNVLIDVSFE